MGRQYHDEPEVLDDASGAQRTHLRPKLTVSQPGDVYEEEADRMAKAFVDMERDSTTSVAGGGDGGGVQRQEMPEEEEEEAMAARKRVSRAKSTVMALVPETISSTKAFTRSTRYSMPQGAAQPPIS